MPTPSHPKNKREFSYWGQTAPAHVLLVGLSVIKQVGYFLFTCWIHVPIYTTNILYKHEKAGHGCMIFKGQRWWKMHKSLSKAALMFWSKLVTITSFHFFSKMRMVDTLCQIQRTVLQRWVKRVNFGFCRGHFPIPIGPTKWHGYKRKWVSGNLKEVGSLLFHFFEVLKSSGTIINLMYGCFPVMATWESLWKVVFSIANGINTLLKMLFLWRIESYTSIIFDLIFWKNALLYWMGILANFKPVHMYYQVKTIQSKYLKIKLRYNELEWGKITTNIWNLDENKFIWIMGFWYFNTSKNNFKESHELPFKIPL